MWAGPVQLGGHRTLAFGNPETSLKPHGSFIHCYFIWSVFHASTYSDLSYPAVKHWAQEKLHRWRGAPAVVLAWEPQDCSPHMSEVGKVDWGGQEGRTPRFKS